MGLGFPFQGNSRKRYSYLLMRGSEIASLPRQAGNYIFAKGDSNAPIPIFIEASDGVRASVNGSNLWSLAQSVHGATFIGFHTNPKADRGVREAEKKDLIDHYAPPMNMRE
jgi:hypothetical protein